MIVGDFDLIRAIVPDETNTPLLIDTNAALSRPGATQFLLAGNANRSVLLRSRAFVIFFQLVPEMI